MKTIVSLFFLSIYFSLPIIAQNISEKSSSENDAIIRKMVNRLKGKKQKTKHILALEDAFISANEKDLEQYEKWKNEPGIEAAEKTYEYGKSIAKRQSRVAPLLPLVSDDGYRPDIRLLPAEEMMQVNYSEIIDYYIKNIRSDLYAASNGKKREARNAFSTLAKMKRNYDWKSPVYAALRDSSLMLGRYFILLEIRNNIFMDGNEVVDELKWDGISTTSQWQVIHHSKVSWVNYDFYAYLNITEADVSGDDKDEEDRKLTQSILLKEATDDEEAKYEEVTAEVTDVKLNKFAKVSADLIVKDIDGNIVIREWFAVQSVFHKEYSICDGDKRALEGVNCESFTLLADDFPSDDEMLEECAEKLGPMVECELLKVDLRE